MTGENSTYPYGSHFQDKVLAVAVQDPVFLQQYYDTLQPSYFDGDFSQSVVEIILAYFKKYQVRPTRSVLLTEAEQYIQKRDMDEGDASLLLKEVNRAFNLGIEDAAYVTEHVIKFAQWQHVQLSVMEIADIVGKERGGEVRPDLVEKLQKAFYVGTGHDLGLQAFDYVDDVPGLLEDDPLFAASNKVRTFYKPFDDALKGGPGGGELYVVAGESGIGKSMFLVNVATAGVKAGNYVVYFTAELKPPDIVVRSFASLANVSMAHVTTNHPKYQERINLWRKQGSQYLRVQYYAPGTATVSMLRAYLARLEAQEGIKPNLIIVDYADELRSAKDYDGNTYLGYGDVYSEMIEMGSVYGCPVWTASQINREGYGKVRPGRNTLSDSQKKMYKADGVLFLCQDDEEKRFNLARLWVDKLRRGPDKFEIPLRFFKGMCKLRMLDRAEQIEFKDVLL